MLAEHGVQKLMYNAEQLELLKRASYLNYD